MNPKRVFGVLSVLAVVGLALAVVTGDVLVVDLSVDREPMQARPDTLGQ